MSTGKRILTDPVAQSASDELPAFLARPAGAPVYHGFPVLAESETEGWYVGAISEYEDPGGCTEGDAFVVAPDGSRAGLVWQVGQGSVAEICAPTPDRWGVYSIWFSSAIHTTAEFIAAFREVLPELKRIHAHVALPPPTSGCS